MLIVDAYLNHLSASLGSIRLAELAAGTAVTVAVGSLDLILHAFAPWREQIRSLLIAAEAEGRAEFSIDLELPVAAGRAATVMAAQLQALGQSESATALHLAPLADDAAQFFSAFLGEVARQLLGDEASSDAIAASWTDLAGALPLDPDSTRWRSAPALAYGGSAHTEAAFPPELASARRARQFVRETLIGHQVSDFVERALLPAGEAIVNALVHSRQPFLVVIVQGPLGIRIEVHDSAPTWPHPRGRGPTADSGRGLVLIDALVDAWGFDAVSPLSKPGSTRRQAFGGQLSE